MDDNRQLSGTDFGKIFQIWVFHQLKVSYLCVCNGFNQIAIDVISCGSSWIVFPRE